MTELPKSGQRHDWIEYRRLVLDSLNTLEDAVEKAADDRKEIRDNQVLLRLDVRALKTKAAIWGGVSGTITAAVIGAIVSKIVGIW